MVYFTISISIGHLLLHLINLMPASKVIVTHQPDFVSAGQDAEKQESGVFTPLPLFYFNSYVALY